MSNTIRLEVGKYYKLRNGEKWKCITNEFPNHRNCILTDGINWQNYTEYGTSISDYHESKFDVVSEWREPRIVEQWAVVDQDDGHVIIVFDRIEDAYTHVDYYNKTYTYTTAIVKLTGVLE